MVRASPLLSSAQARALVRAHPPKPWIYWTDLLGSSALAWGLFGLSLWTEPFSAGYWAASVAAMFVFLRAGYFMHEIAHRNERELPGFEWAWNLLIGVPILIPSFMIWPHIDHHRPATYGTSQDPEYAPIAGWTRGRMVASLLGFGLIPLYLPLRFGLLGPLSAAVAPARTKAWEQFSTVDINAAYRRAPPKAEERPTIRAQEILCSLFVWGALGATALGLLPVFVHLQRLVVMCGSLMINHSRTLVVHFYASGGEAQSLQEQVEDTITLEGRWWWTGLFAPLGSQYHALHHALPTLPYHALWAVHREILKQESRDAPGYTGTRIGGIWQAWAFAWSRAARALDSS